MNRTSNSNQWTPDWYLQAFKEVVTAILGLAIVLYSLIMANNAFNFAGDETRMSDAKDVLLLMLGLSGVVLGYYFGRIPADARATQAQEQANTTMSQIVRMKEKVKGMAKEMERAKDTIPSNDPTANKMEQLADELRAMADGS
jgi:hypothetical protein